MGIYYSPESFGVECVGQVDWGAMDQFDLTAVWVDEQKTLYWADDAGCSCVTRFESVESLEDLRAGTLQQLAAHLLKRCDHSKEPDARADVVELLGRADRMTRR